MTGVITNDDADAALQRIRRQLHETPFLSARRLGDRADGRDELTGEAFASGTGVVRRLRHATERRRRALARPRLRRSGDW
jgi:hypothetical protein